MPEPVSKIQHSGTLSPDQTADMLMAFAHALKEGKIGLTSNGQSLLLELSQQVDIKVVAKKKSGESSVMLRLEWIDAKPAVSTPLIVHVGEQSMAAPSESKQHTDAQSNSPELAETSAAKNAAPKPTKKARTEKEASTKKTAAKKAKSSTARKTTGSASKKTVAKRKTTTSKAKPKPKTT